MYLEWIWQSFFHLLYKITTNEEQQTSHGARPYGAFRPQGALKDTSKYMDLVCVQSQLYLM